MVFLKELRDPAGPGIAVIAGALTLAAQQGALTAALVIVAVLSFRVAAGLIATSFRPKASLHTPRAGSAWYEPLTKRESEVAELIAGHTNREIGELLLSTRTVDGHLSERAVETYVQNIFNKLGFNDRSEIAAWVAERKARATPPATTRRV